MSRDTEGGGTKANETGDNETALSNHSDCKATIFCLFVFHEHHFVTFYCNFSRNVINWKYRGQEKSRERFN